MTIEISFHTFADLEEFEDFACEMLNKVLEQATFENGGKILMDADEIARLDDDDPHYYYSSAVVAEYEALQAELIGAGIAHYQLKEVDILSLDIESDLIIEQ